MNKNKIIDTTTSFVKDTLKDEPTGHDWHHIERVLNLSEKISKTEGGDIFKIKLIALLHDISDYKLYKTEQKGIDKLNAFLNSIIDEPDLKQEIINTINGISFKGLLVKEQELSLEGQIVQDADRLDAIGAIGIARAFAYGGNKNRAMHNPKEKPKKHQSFKEYKSSKGSTINHFYEKLLHLKDRLNTNSAKNIAAERHQFMQDFICQFFKEWDSKL